MARDGAQGRPRRRGEAWENLDQVVVKKKGVMSFRFQLGDIPARVIFVFFLYKGGWGCEFNFRRVGIVFT